MELLILLDQPRELLLQDAGLPAGACDILIDLPSVVSAHLNLEHVVARNIGLSHRFLRIWPTSCSRVSPGTPETHADTLILG
jgi:hypothetical protein